MEEQNVDKNNPNNKTNNWYLPVCIEHGEQFGQNEKGTCIKQYDMFVVEEIQVIFGHK